MHQPASAEVPGFAKHSALLSGAFWLAASLHHGPRRAGDTDIGHPVEVAELLASEGFGEEVVAAALLHETIEDTDASAPEIEARFGPEIAELVAEMTENEGIEAYRRRKAEHRERISADRRVAAIYAADKLATARSIEGGIERAPAEKIEHYLQTLILLEQRQPDLPFLQSLREELTKLGRG
jgi:(p)ppGpp synthase/HD superfamily hydrolase